MISPRRYSRVLVDTGPLVALLSAKDACKEICNATIVTIDPPLLTCWPVITEAAWMLRPDWSAIHKLYQSPQDGWVSLMALDADDLSAIDQLQARYASLSPQLADLALVRLAQREGLDTIFTLDRRDFSVYKLKGRKGFRLLPEA